MHCKFIQGICIRKLTKPRLVLLESASIELRKLLASHDWISAVCVMCYCVGSLANTHVSDDSINRSIWSGVEICVAIVCANLATLRPILNYLRTGKAVSVPNASTNNTAPSSGAWHGSGKSNPRRWTWRNVGASAGQPAKEGTFHRLEQQPGARSTDDVERQKFEGYLMSPVGSPRIPDNAHARDSDWPRSPMR